jgi:energy-coupling factor transporter transmembrane protein EcfT
MLPTIQETMSSSIAAMRLRGGFRRDRLSSLRRLFVTVVAGSLRRGEEIVDSAEARAFDPQQVHAALPRPRLGDMLLALVLCGAALVIMLV